MARHKRAAPQLSGMLENPAKSASYRSEKRGDFAPVLGGMDMSQQRALVEIERFLASGDPEVLSISGRWGVGKTYAWDTTLRSKRASAAVRRYAYVSAFGLKSLDALKTAIVQSTVSLEGNELEPTVDSFVEHLRSFEGLRKLGGEVTRKGLNIFATGAAAIPHVGKMADLLAPGASLLIRNQIVCIDDIERAGKGLDVADILGLVSFLRERRNCKVVLLLNEDGLGKQGAKYRQYLEKVVDQAVAFEPTAEESIAAALPPGDDLGELVAKQAIILGITNIRVIRRIRRFLSYLEPQMAGLHDGVVDNVVHSIVLIGWCVFEPKLAPDIERVRRHNLFLGMLGEDQRTAEELRDDQILQSYGFGGFDKLDELLFDGLRAGAFDTDALQIALAEVNGRYANEDVRKAIQKPWDAFGESFDADADALMDSLVASIEDHAGAMSPGQASDALDVLRELGRPQEAERLLPIYLEAQNGRPREFFATGRDGARRPIDPAIVAAFEQKLNDMPLEKDPAQILIDIGTKNAWNPADVAFLATVPVDKYVDLLRQLRGDDLHSAVRAGLRFGEFANPDGNDQEVAKRMDAALKKIGEDNALNRMRVKPYLKNEPPAEQAG